MYNEPVIVWSATNVFEPVVAYEPVAFFSAFISVYWFASTVDNDELNVE